LLLLATRYEARSRLARKLRACFDVSIQIARDGLETPKAGSS